MKNRTKLSLGAISTLMTISAFTYQVNALKQQEMSLPISIYDYNYDNIFFEYDLNSGLSLGDGITSSTGLVEPNLVDNHIVYTKEAVSKAANLMAQELLNYDTNTLNSTVFKKYKKAFTKPAQGNILEEELGNADNYFYTKSWQTTHDYKKINGTVVDGDGIAWKQGGDGVKNYGNDTALEKEYLIAKNTTYTFSLWHEGVITIKVSDASGTLKTMTTDNGNGWLEGFSFTSSSDKVKITISGNNSRIAAASLVGNNVTISSDFGSEAVNNYFYDKGWKIVNSNNKVFQASNGAYINGKILFHQDGNGVVFDEKNQTLTKTYAVTANQLYNLKYYLERTGIDVKITDHDNQKVILDHSYENDVEAWNDFSFTVPANTTKVDITLTSKTDNDPRIAALTITPLGSVILGNYEDAKQKFSNPNKNINHVASCYDYCYYMMNNFFKSKSDINSDYKLFNNLVLKQTENDNYNFTADYDAKDDVNCNIVYDYKNKTLSNGSNGDLRYGFFPIDAYGESFTGKVDGNSIGEHNYHYSMRCQGTFTYSKAKNLYFNFAGDDDVYLFINNHLALDIGGAHLSVSKELSINDIATEFGLVDGNDYNFDFFYMERHTDFSNLRLDTNIDVKRRIVEANDATLIEPPVENSQPEKDNTKTDDDDIILAPSEKDDIKTDDVIVFTPSEKNNIKTDDVIVLAPYITLVVTSLLGILLIKKYVK